MQGFENLGSYRNQPWAIAGCRPRQQLTTLDVNDLDGDAHSTAVEKPQTFSGKSPMMEEVRNGDDQMEDGHMSGTNTAGAQNQISDFEAMIRDIDEAINMEPVFSNSKAGNSESLLAIDGNDLHCGSNGSTIKDMGSSIQLLGKEEDS